MTDGPAPTPPTTDELLAQLVDEVRGLRQDLEDGRGGPTAPVDGKVELREPAV